MVEGAASFCGRCGSSVSNSEGVGYGQNQENNWQNNYGPSNNSSYQGYHGLGGTLTIIMALGILWAIYSVIGGIICMFGWGLLTGIYGDLGTGVYVVIGVLSVISGLLAFLACKNIYNLEEQKKTFNYCLIGSILGLITGGIIAGIVGIVFALLISKESYRFRS